MALLIIYSLIVLSLKIYTLLPIILNKEQAIEVNKTEIVKRNDFVIMLLSRLTLIGIIYVAMTSASGIFSILVGDSFYEIFKHRASLAEAYDEEAEGKFNKTSYNLFKFGLRMVLINLIIIKPLFGRGPINYLLNNKIKL